MGCLMTLPEDARLVYSRGRWRLVRGVLHWTAPRVVQTREEAEAWAQRVVR